MNPARLVVAILGPTACGKSALGLSLAERFQGEVVSCDSTAVYRGFDIGTDKVPVEKRRGVPHHLVNIVDPTELYTAARYASDAARAIEDINGRGRLPILVGGSGLYYRALTRGLFPGPGRDAALRARFEKVASRRGPERLHRMLHRVDPPSAVRIQPRDTRRLIRALEVFALTGVPLTTHFDATTSPLEGWTILAVALRIPSEQTERRVAARVDEQFDRGLVQEVKGLLAKGVPQDAPPFGGLVYRQVLEHLSGLRNEADTRALIVRENKRYARRQLIWFRKEPNLVWLPFAGEHSDALAAVADLLESRRREGS